MTKNLTERLQARLESQTAEIEALTTTELRKLAANLSVACEEELHSMRNAIRMTTGAMDADLVKLRRFGRWWWVALIVTWLMIGGLYAWHSMRQTAGIGLYQTFTYEGGTYLMLPEGTQVLTCRRGERRMPCAALPRGE